jgi:capsular polysaccharide biosynthesis protein
VSIFVCIRDVYEWGCTKAKMKRGGGLNVLYPWRIHWQIEIMFCLFINIRHQESIGSKWGTLQWYLSILCYYTSPSAYTPFRSMFLKKRERKKKNKGKDTPHKSILVSRCQLGLFLQSVLQLVSLSRYITQKYNDSFSLFD